MRDQQQFEAQELNAAFYFAHGKAAKKAGDPLDRIGTAAQCLTDANDSIGGWTGLWRRIRRALGR